MASATLPSPREHSRVTIRSAAIAFGLLAALAMQAELAFSTSINWDEMFHWSQVHAGYRGEPVALFQTPYVRLFAWLPALGLHPVDEIRLARLFLWPLGAITAGLIYLTACRFGSRQAVR